MSTLLLGGPTQDYQHHYLVTAVGPHASADIATWWAQSGLSTLFLLTAVGPSVNVNIATQWAHSGLSASLFSNGCGPIRKYRHCYLVGPLRIIGIISCRRLWAHTRMSTLLLGGPIRYYGHHYSATAVGPYANINIAALVGPFRVMDIIFRRWPLAHSQISTSILQRAHSRLSIFLFYGDCRPIHNYRSQYSALDVGPFDTLGIFAKYIDFFGVISQGAHMGLSTLTKLGPMHII